MNTVLTPTSASQRPTFDLEHTPTARRGWAYAGLAAGIGAFALFLGPASMLSTSRDAYADNNDIVAELAGKQGWIWAFQSLSFVVAILLVVFGAGLRRRLAGQEPARSLLPDLAFAGLLLVAAMTLVGGGISTEMFHSLRHADESDPDTIAGQLTIFATMAWVWAGGILTTGAVAVAALRHGSMGRGLGRFAAVMSALIVLTQAVPLQYLAVLPVALFLIVCSISMIRSEASLDKLPGTDAGSR